MEIRPGYKKTEVGVIPKDWDPYALGKGISLLSGHHILAEHCNTRGDGVPYLTGPADFPDGAILQTKFTTKPSALCQPEDILVTVKGSGSGNLVVADNVYCISRQLMAIRPREWNKQFVFYSLIQCASQFRAASTGLIPGLSRSDILEQSLPIPPLPEQRTIATALSDVDSLAGALRGLIVKKRDLKQAAMHQLLTGQTRLPGFSDLWVVKPLSAEIDDLESGTSVNSDQDDGEGQTDRLSVLKTSSVTGGRFLPSESKTISPRDLNRVKLSPRAETVIISRMNTIDLVGECGYVSEDHPKLFIPDRLWMTRFKVESRISAKWLAFALSTPALRILIRGIATGTSGSMKNIAKGKFLSLEVAFPNSDEQSAIAYVLTDMDAEIETLEQRLTKARDLKQAMMQELLTGRIRLVQPEARYA